MAKMKPSRPTIKRSAAVKPTKRKRSFSEKAIMVLGVIIALSMILALVVSFTPQPIG